MNIEHTENFIPVLVEPGLIMLVRTLHIRQVHSAYYPDCVPVTFLKVEFGGRGIPNEILAKACENMCKN